MANKKFSLGDMLGGILDQGADFAKDALQISQDVGAIVSQWDSNDPAPAVAAQSYGDMIEFQKQLLALSAAPSPQFLPIPMSVSSPQPTPSPYTIPAPWTAQPPTVVC